MLASTPMNILQEAAEGVTRLLKLLKKSDATQVKSKEEQQIIKATALAWFNNYRPSLNIQDSDAVKAVGAAYMCLFECTSRATSRRKYQEILKKLKATLLVLQSQVLSTHASEGNADMLKPDFSPLVPDAKMQKILENRWDEIIKCLKCNIPLAATIMMGGLLEALFLARTNKLVDKSPVFKAKTAPRNKETQQTLPLDKWMLSSYIEVGAELGWIRRPAKDIGIVLRDYRNFIHPERELSTGFTPDQEDAALFWQIFTHLSRQIIANAG